MTVEMLTMIAAAALSLLFEYVPGFSDWFSGFSEVQKRLGMAALMFLVAVAVFGLNCANQIVPGLPAVSCDAAGGWGLLATWFLALGANQVTHLLTKRPMLSI